jgi:HEAT repeat protein
MGFLWRLGMAVCLPCLLIAAPGITEDEGIRRVQAHLLLEDNDSALSEASELYESFPGSRPVGSIYIEALAANGLEAEALQAWNILSSRYPDIVQDRHLLEELSWGVLRKGVDSNQYAVRLASLIGSYLTRDVRAVKILLRMMRDSNAVIRSVAVQMASGFADAPLKDEITRLMAEEKIWFVRLEIIKAAGTLRMKNLAPKLQAILASEKNTFEERQLAIAALVEIYDQISVDELKNLAKSNRAPMRHLACNLAAHFRIKEAKDEIVHLASDSHPDVRVAALNAIGLVYLNDLPPDAAKGIVQKAMEDANPPVAITAAWVAALIDPALSEPGFLSYLNSDLAENRRLAAAALAAAGGRAESLAKRVLAENPDPYVRANVALGLIGQRAEVQRCCDTLYDFLMKEKKMWMLDNRANPLFQVLAPSEVRHIDQIPNYPEAIDQMTRLNLVSVLALVDDPRAQDALKSFLQKKTWGITGVAAATLLQEGDAGAIDIVRNLLQDPDPDVRLQACLVLSMLAHDETVLFELQKAYPGSDHERKLHILEAFGRIGNPDSYAFLVGVLDEPFQILRVAAAAGLIQSLNR